MSIINSNEIEAIPSKTIIYFTQKTNTYLHLPDSYVYTVPHDLSLMIFEMRRFDIAKFPIVCYDNSNMQLASRAFWIFEALGYSALVVYGNLELFVQQGANLVKENLGAINYSSTLMEIGPGKLDWVNGVEGTVEDLFEALYQSVQTYCSPEKIAEFIRGIGLDLEKSDWCFSGRNCELLGLLMRESGGLRVEVSLGEWSELASNTESSRTETFFSLASSVYYDIEEPKETESVARAEADENKKNDEDTAPVKTEEISARKIEVLASIKNLELQSSWNEIDIQSSAKEREIQTSAHEIEIKTSVEEIEIETSANELKFQKSVGELEVQTSVREEKKETAGETNIREEREEEQYRGLGHYSTSLSVKNQNNKKQKEDSDGCSCNTCNIS